MDKRSSKLFGGRISSIFNAHTHGSPHSETGTFQQPSASSRSDQTGVAGSSRFQPSSVSGSDTSRLVAASSHEQSHHQQPKSPVVAEFSSPQTPANHSHSFSHQKPVSSSADSLFPSPQVSSVLGSPMRPLSSKPLQNSSRSPAYSVNLGPVPYSPTKLSDSGIPEHSEFPISPPQHKAPRRKPPPDLLSSEFDFVGPVYSTADVGSPVSASKEGKFEDELSNVADFRDIIEKIDSEITDGSGLEYPAMGSDDDNEVISNSGSSTGSRQSSDTESDVPYRHTAPLLHQQYYHDRENSTEPPSEDENDVDDDSRYRDEFLMNDGSSSSKNSYIQPLETRASHPEELGVMAQAPYPVDDTYARHMWNDNDRIDSSEDSFVRSSAPYPAGSTLSGSSSSSATSLELPHHQQSYPPQKIMPTRTVSSGLSAQSPVIAPAVSMGGAITPSTTRSASLTKSDSIRTTGTNASSSFRVPYKGPLRQESIDTVSGLNTVELRAKSSISRSLGHRKTGSIGSLHSMYSNRNVNLATLKKSFNLRPGEGERSVYVSTIRKSSGAANNDTAPGKWKLPTALQVIDRSAIQTAKYLRMSSGSKLKKSSGVELKHGHLQRRLLRSEADDFDDSEIVSRSPLARSGTETSRILTHVLSTNTDASQATILTSNTYSSTSSVDKTSSLAPGATNTTSNSSEQNNELLEAEASSSNTTQLERSRSVSSSSSGSISSSSMAAGVYYQHPGYNNKSDDDINGSITSASSTLNNDEASEYDGFSRLVLVNPDGED